MALWKQWMTIEDKASFGKDEWHCRKTPLPWMKQWHCLWDTAYWGPHGFLFGTNEESKSDATDLKTCARRPAADRPRAGRRPARARAPARRAPAPARPRARRLVADRRAPTAAPPRSQVPATSGGSSSAPHRDVPDKDCWRTRSNPPTWRAADAGKNLFPPVSASCSAGSRADQHLSPAARRRGSRTSRRWRRCEEIGGAWRGAAGCRSASVRSDPSRRARPGRLSGSSGGFLDRRGGAPAPAWSDASRGRAALFCSAVSACRLFLGSVVQPQSGLGDESR